MSAMMNAMAAEHSYALDVAWTGNRGTGTSGYRDYDRDHTVTAPGKPPLRGSADPAFRGEADRWNPEELLVASLSQCHMLSYLALAVAEGVVVIGYTDQPTGRMHLNPDGSGQFTEVILAPKVLVADPSMVAAAERLHADAHDKCFIARSVNFPVEHRADITVAGAAR
ncbi:organic hydroperoxide reductase OsmC/OhrA [Prescottella agglutinans]|uniref:Organic hydroperoxide reductase OsmC/OhrA n=2 Tax=Prescottella agglutinans TaxID=1644129 RepID=A0ABT6MAC8_9NOCA|nr:organic hydroperoxide reductase OsmC/OhrA [Prescottella agglutinans]